MDAAADAAPAIRSSPAARVVLTLAVVEVHVYA